MSLLTAHSRAPSDVVRIASSDVRGTSAAVTQVLDQVGASDASLVFVFYSPDHDAATVAQLLAARCETRGIGGSTAGELSPSGFRHGTVVAVALHGSHVRAGVTIIPSVSNASLLPVTTIASELARQIGREASELDPKRHVWMLLFDGLSGLEDFFTPVFAANAPKLEIVGGSFGDESRFERATMVHDGVVYEDGAAILLLEYGRPFEVLHHTHMELTERCFEVSATAQGGRVLLELDGRPAKEVYSEALGLDVDEVTPGVTGERPLGFRFRGRAFPCSVVRMLPQGLLLAYSVQVGDRLFMLNPRDIVEETHRAMAAGVARLRAAGGSPQAMLAFHCLGRYLEARHHGLIEPLFQALQEEIPVAGLNTYGEQYGPRHMNHSITGILFG